MKILVVDDEPEIREHLKYILESEGHTVETAVNSEECSEQIKFFRPELLIMDIMIGKINGFALIKLIKAVKLPLPIIAITGLHSEGLVADLDKAGVKCLHKPFKPEELFSLIKMNYPTSNKAA